LLSGSYSQNYKHESNPSIGIDFTILQWFHSFKHWARSSSC